jgi:hypothetical protein
MPKYTFEVAGAIVGKYRQVIAKNGEISIDSEVVAAYYKQGANFAIKIVGVLGVCHGVFPTLKDAAQAVLLHHIRPKKQ